ncbi:Catechol-2,3-dioxygenase [Quadrisphaera granulorum]|uniref:Catechol-2,3-dioxygenase n=1 Tax=Quadrisphaera granulorum TaxID=317664 RepID=A0A316AH47_9ACTN|nr:VOC family protein [Quadrisphaera granulorum]PWJ56224.1 catechol-2,3-dioxygenase [Quadrisphaera granulorum]SZE94858.1 Catechol-2,3-dioxygenase [Quadrisphaera granulorum]
MKITSVTVPVDDLAEAERFYGRTLGLPVRRDRGAALVVTVGGTEVRLVEQQSERAVDHLAITVPADAFSAAKSWLRERVELMTLDGQDEFEGSLSWRSRSLYFSGPSGSVLELIARHRLPALAGDVPFGPEHLLCVSEVGVAVPDVPAAIRLLQEATGLKVFGEGVGETFAAVGDDDGLLIVVAEGRPWFPTSDRRVTATPRAVTATGVCAAPIQLQLGSTTVSLHGAEATISG